MAAHSASFPQLRDLNGNGRMVDELLECARLCFACAGSAWLGLSIYLDSDAPAHMPDEALVVVDCAEACEATARSLVRRSPSRALICAFTAELCERAATVARRQPHLRPVVLPALRCARSCRSLAEE